MTQTYLCFDKTTYFIPPPSAVVPRCLSQQSGLEMPLSLHVVYLVDLSDVALFPSSCRFLSLAFLEPVALLVVRLQAIASLLHGLFALQKVVAPSADRVADAHCQGTFAERPGRARW